MSSSGCLLYSRMLPRHFNASWKQSVMVWILCLCSWTTLWWSAAMMPYGAHYPPSQLLQCLQKCSLVLKVAKCQFCVFQIYVLEHCISEHGTTPSSLIHSGRCCSDYVTPLYSFVRPSQDLGVEGCHDEGISGRHGQEPAFT